MQIHQLSSTNKKNKKRVARGGAHGVFSGRGAKGQKSRAGRNFAPIVRALFKRYPKKRGYRVKGFNELTTTFQLTDLLKSYKEKEIISPKTLAKKGLISLIEGKYPTVKILGQAKVESAIKISGCLTSKTVKDSIEKAGGQVIFIEKKKPLKIKKKKAAKEPTAEKEAPAKKAAKKAPTKKEKK